MRILSVLKSADAFPQIIWLWEFGPRLLPKIEIDKKKFIVSLLLLRFQISCALGTFYLQ